LVTLVAWSSSSPAAEAVRLSYATDGLEAVCPGSGDFAASVRERLRIGSVLADGGSAREYRVNVRRVGSRFAARLDFVDRSGAPRTREVGAGTCDDVARAIALVTALAIDAAGTDAEADSASDGVLSPSEALGLVEPNVAPAPPASPWPPANSAPPPPMNRSYVEGPPSHLTLGAQATATSPKGPAILPGAEVFVGLIAPNATWLLELGVAGELGARAAVGPGSARFSFAGARLRGCAPSWALGGAFELRPCALVEAGALFALGYIDDPKSQVDPWLAAGAAVRLSRTMGSGALRLEAGPVFPIVRNQYVFGPAEGPNTRAHEVPWVGLYLALGGSLQIL
jgi:hypothetical protein